MTASARSRHLAAADKIPADLPISCRLLEDGADAGEICLAENVVRIAMHPADQFEAFRDLIDKGSSAADVAARFSVPEATVAKRLKLGCVSPALLDAYRAGERGLEQVQAFAVSDDPEAQERIWAALNGRRADPNTIRRALTEDEEPSTDRRDIFIGLEAYEAASGSVRHDLFDQEGGGYLQDAALLDRLVQEKLEALADTVRAEVWSWTEAHAEFGYEARAPFRRCYPEEIPLPQGEADELDALQAEYDELEDAQYDDDGEEDAAVTTRLKAIQERIDALTGRAGIWKPELLAGAGALVHLSADGAAEVERGLIRPGDAAGDAQDGAEVG